MQNRISNKNILYISYDGMTDPLGQSQVLPYIIGLSKQGFQFTLLTAEKPKRYEQFGSLIKDICGKNGINWVTVPFTEFPPFFSKIHDVQVMTEAAVKLHKKHSFSLVHCRSYIAADIGIKLKKKFGVKFLFDMRGFWVDERVEGGMWNISNPFFKLAYKVYKRKEASYISLSDQIISLTQSGKKEMESWASYKNNPIQVIPCSADFALFSYVTEEERVYAKIRAGYTGSHFVVSYLGSLGTWYMLDEMLHFFSLLKSKYSNAKLLIITPDSPELVLTKLKNFSIREEDVKVVFAARAEVRNWIAASDISLSFIKQSYSKIASSPTKLGELLAMGIPVICNSKVGDVQQIIEMTGGGILIDEFSAEEYVKAIGSLSDLLKSDRSRIRERAASYYDLEDAIKNYTLCYERLLKN